MTLTMFDSIYPDQFPGGPAAVAGYVNGHWATYYTLVKKFPKAHVLSIDVFGNADADCVDVESGDATIATAVEWVKRRQAQGLRRPVVYTSVSNANALLAALKAQGIRRGDIRLWTAHYTFTPHFCSPACYRGFTDQADATQWTDKYAGRSLDASLVSDSFFAAPPDKPLDSAPTGEPKNDNPFTRPLWPNPIPSWFWPWAWWRQNEPKDKEAHEAWKAARPADAPRLIPAWAWIRLKAL